MCWLQVDDLDLPIKRNQAFVIRSFSKNRDKFCDHLLGEGKKEFRWRVLTEVQPPLMMYSYMYVHPCPLPQLPDDAPDVELLLALTDMLASCAEGENLFIESVCQTIYKVK